jgi:hypothetical protein
LQSVSRQVEIETHSFGSWCYISAIFLLHFCYISASQPELKRRGNLQQQLVAAGLFGSREAIGRSICSWLAVDWQSVAWQSICSQVAVERQSIGSGFLTVKKQAVVGSQVAVERQSVVYSITVWPASIARSLAPLIVCAPSLHHSSRVRQPALAVLMSE